MMREAKEGLGQDHCEPIALPSRDFGLLKLWGIQNFWTLCVMLQDGAQVLVSSSRGTHSKSAGGGVR